MPGPEEIGANIFAAPERVAGCLFLIGRHVDGRQGPGVIQHRHVARIAAACL